MPPPATKHVDWTIEEALSPLHAPDFQLRDGLRGELEAKIILHCHSRNCPRPNYLPLVHQALGTVKAAVAALPGRRRLAELEGKQQEQLARREQAIRAGQAAAARRQDPTLVSRGDFATMVSKLDGQIRMFSDTAAEAEGALAVLEEHINEARRSLTIEAQRVADMISADVAAKAAERWRSLVAKLAAAAAPILDLLAKEKSYCGVQVDHLEAPVCSAAIAAALDVGDIELGGETK